jgi:hypothetical protein
MKSYHIIIDTKALNCSNPLDCTLDCTIEKIPTHFKRIGLKSFVIDGPSSAFKNLFVHCDILNKDDNIFNGSQSDILAIISNKKYMYYQSENRSYKNIKSDFTSLRIFITDCQNNVRNLSGVNSIIYELELIE